MNAEQLKAKRDDHRQQAELFDDKYRAEMVRVFKEEREIDENELPVFEATAKGARGMVTVRIVLNNYNEKDGLFGGSMIDKSGNLSERNRWMHPDDDWRYVGAFTGSTTNDEEDEL